MLKLVRVLIGVFWDWLSGLALSKLLLLYRGMIFD